MGLLTLIDFRTRLQTMLGNQGFTDTELDYWINDGVQDVAGALDLKKLRCIKTVETAANDNNLSLPNDFVAPLALKIDGQQKLTSMGVDQYFLYDPTDSDNVGVPRSYVWSDSGLWLYPVPDDIYTVRMLYRRDAAQLAVDTDTSEFPATYDRAILLSAVHHGFFDTGDTLTSADALARFMTYIRSRIQPEEWEAEAWNDRGVWVPTSLDDLRGFES